MHHQIECISNVKQTPWSDATLKRLQQEYLELVPHIRQRARFRFRAIRCPGRHADMVAEAIALGWKLYLRMHERGIDLRQWHRWFTYIAAQLPVQHRLAGIKRQDVLDKLNRVSTGTYSDAFLDNGPTSRLWLRSSWIGRNSERNFLRSKGRSPIRSPNVGVWRKLREGWESRRVEYSGAGRGSESAGTNCSRKND